MKNKKVRLYINGVRQRDVYQYLTKWQVFVHRVKTFFKVLFWGIIVASVLIGIFEAGSYLNPATVYTKAEVIKEVPVKAPILDRIAKCESPTGHYGSNGQVVVQANDNNTVDIGKYQINNYYWGAKATEMGLNLFIEKDNETMAHWIYENKGTEPWSSSKKCWNK